MRQGDLAQWIAEFACSEIAPTGDALDAAKKVFCDTVAATIAGATSDVLGPLAKAIRSTGNVKNISPILGTGIKASAEHCAMLNGTMAAALEFDDVLSLMPAHPSAVILAALLATEHALAAPGKNVIEAYAVGVESGARIAQAMTLDHYKRGFHATGTLALFSAVAALTRIRKLSISQCKQSLGLAASMSSGLQANFGTMTKPLHSGWAARNAVIAVDLVCNGLTANERIFESEGGYFDAYGSGLSALLRATNSLGNPWVFVEPGITLKLFPCCYASHRGMDALRDIMRDLQVSANQIREIRCKTPPGGLIPLKFPAPSTHFESLFSFPYALAVTALDGMPDLASFQQTRVIADDVKDMLTRIKVVESHDCVANYPNYQQDSYGSRGEVHIEVETHNDRHANRVVRFAPGHPERPMTWENAREKFEGCLKVAKFAPQVAAQAFPLLRSIETVPVFGALAKSLTHLENLL